ncbi:hypothetical protein AVEN_232322-1 [Araneus ventricosus]|uniref:Uncharacterized protein n=1 Tax=Araneus ventricosus TaxID=182803 RepID=A0A4Y2HJ75_ARAVE|nr:hypothetical protein AVEN_232322-1 [Araneus ventricosus]
MAAVAPSGKVSASSRRVLGSKPDSTEDLPCMWACCTLNHTYGVNRPTAGVVRKFGEGMPVQMSSSSADLGSKLRGSSQNSPRVASKRDINITKLTETLWKG